MPILVGEVHIRGTRPFLFNCFSVDKIPLEKKEKRGVAGNDPDEWRDSFKVTKEGFLFVDSTYAFGCIRNGAKFIKSGKRSVQKDVVATLQILDDKLIFNRKVPESLDKIPTDISSPVYLDIRPVRAPSGSGRNIRYRLAMSPGWETTFRIAWDSSVVGRDLMKAVLYDSGKLVGIGDGREIGNGRFDVVSFTISELENERKIS